ncbi:hypothetical protein HMPREF3114_18465 [Stenotrophomonas sp. HMSC10F07]|nr:hypothetical protein HMPREF3114_18465 [Stenotrophomonas sp. HMSC10F07]
MLCALVVAMITADVAHAGIQLNATRVVYSAGEREASLSMVNNGSDARLVQAWIDSGDISERPENSKAPFLVTPPMSRVDPGKGQTLRIMLSDATLPQDRESVYWLNVLEIPPKPRQADGGAPQNYVQMAVRTRIKLFYRPKGLVGTPETAVKNLVWHLRSRGGASILECTNGTPFNVSFSDVSFKNAPPNMSVSKGGMCPAKGVAEFPVPGSPNAAAGQLVLTVVNDYGAFVPYEATFSP